MVDRREVDHTITAALDSRGEGVIGVSPQIQDEFAYQVCVQALHPRRSLGFDATFEAANKTPSHTEFPLPGQDRLMSRAHDLLSAMTEMGFVVDIADDVYEQPLAA